MGLCFVNNPEKIVKNEKGKIIVVIGYRHEWEHHNPSFDGKNITGTIFFSNDGIGDALNYTVGSNNPINLIGHVLKIEYFDGSRIKNWFPEHPTDLYTNFEKNRLFLKVCGT